MFAFGHLFDYCLIVVLLDLVVCLDCLILLDVCLVCCFEVWCLPNGLVALFESQGFLFVGVCLFGCI